MQGIVYIRYKLRMPYLQVYIFVRAILEIDL
jgi:hypothetical protein